MVKRGKSDNSTPGLERVPGFVELSKVRDLHHQHHNSNMFTDMRKECYDLGLNLERARTGYFLSGRDLPPAGVHCRTLSEVEEELRNYG